MTTLLQNAEESALIARADWREMLLKATFRKEWTTLDRSDDVWPKKRMNPSIASRKLVFANTSQASIRIGHGRINTPHLTAEDINVGNVTVNGKM